MSPHFTDGLNLTRWGARHVGRELVYCIMGACAYTCVGLLGLGHQERPERSDLHLPCSAWQLEDSGHKGARSRLRAQREGRPLQAGTTGQDRFPVRLGKPTFLHLPL